MQQPKLGAHRTVLARRSGLPVMRNITMHSPTTRPLVAKRSTGQIFTSAMEANMRTPLSRIAGTMRSDSTEAWQNARAWHLG